jgi:hypothetical protein
MTEKINIQAIAPFLADDFVDLVEPIFDIDRYSKFLNDNAARLGTYKKYLICKLHDSSVIGTTHDNNRFTITLNDYSTYVFADTMIDKYNLPIDSDHISFPLTLELTGDLIIEFNNVDDDGNLIKISPTKIDEYLYEQVTHLDQDRIQIVFHFWQSNLKDDKPGSRIIVIASANGLSVTENQDHAWLELFGDKYNGLYKYFKKQFDSDRFVSDHSECEKLIDEYVLIN